MSFNFNQGDRTFSCVKKNGKFIISKRLPILSVATKKILYLDKAK